MQIIENHNVTEPLFLYLAYQAPHMNIQKPPQKYLDLYKEDGGRRSRKIYQDNLQDDGQALHRAAAISVSSFDAFAPYYLYSVISVNIICHNPDKTLLNKISINQGFRQLTFSYK